MSRYTEPNEHKTDLKKSQIYLIWCQSGQMETKSDHMSVMTAVRRKPLTK